MKSERLIKRIHESDMEGRRRGRPRMKTRGAEVHMTEDSTMEEERLLLNRDRGNRRQFTHGHLVRDMT